MVTIFCFWVIRSTFDRSNSSRLLLIHDHQHQVHNQTLHHSSTILLILGIKRRESSQDGKGGEEDSSCKFLLGSCDASCSFSTAFGRRKAIISDIRCHSLVDPSLLPWNDLIKPLILELNLRKTKSEGFREEN